MSWIIKSRDIPDLQTEEDFALKVGDKIVTTGDYRPLEGDFISPTNEGGWYGHDQNTYLLRGGYEWTVDKILDESGRYILKSSRGDGLANYKLFNDDGSKRGPFEVVQ